MSQIPWYYGKVVEKKKMESVLLLQQTQKEQIFFEISQYLKNYIACTRYRNSLPKMLKIAFKNCAIFTRKPFFYILPFSYRNMPCNSIKKETPSQVFPVHFTQLLRKPTLQNICEEFLQIVRDIMVFHIFSFWHRSVTSDFMVHFNVHVNGKKRAFSKTNIIQ